MMHNNEIYTPSCVIFQSSIFFDSPCYSVFFFFCFFFFTKTQVHEMGHVVSQKFSLFDNRDMCVCVCAKDSFLDWKRMSVRLQFTFFLLFSILICFFPSYSPLLCVRAWLFLLKLGIGTLWQDNGLQSSTSSSSCQYGANTRATSEYRRISGCSSATIPIERDGGSGTACGHWDDECFKGEIMTGYASGNMAMSTMTLASLEDMGFTVDYSRADPYSASDMASMCKCSGATVADGATTSTT